jgi:hypothetical protein
MIGHELLALVALHFFCNATAETRLLSASEVTRCAENYTEMKLGFVGVEDRSVYDAMDPADRNALNLDGYAAYLDWKAENPALVADLEARAEAALDADNPEAVLAEGLDLAAQ